MKTILVATDLIVPESAEFKNIETMALAVDHDADEGMNPRLLDVFREIAERFCLRC